MLKFPMLFALNVEEIAHRDTMAAQNQAIRKRSELFDDSIPIQFQSTSVSDTFTVPTIGTGTTGRQKNSNGKKSGRKKKRKESTCTFDDDIAMNVNSKIKSRRRNIPISSDAYDFIAVNQGSSTSGPSRESIRSSH